MKIEKRILDFEQMGVGMFIHYGLYSLVGRGEKSPAFLRTTPWNEYCALPERFSAEIGWLLHYVNQHTRIFV